MDICRINISYTMTWDVLSNINAHIPMKEKLFYIHIFMMLVARACDDNPYIVANNKE